MEQWRNLVCRARDAATLAVVGALSSFGSQTLAVEPTAMRVAPPALGRPSVDMTADEWSRKHGKPAPEDIPKALALLGPYAASDPWAATIYAALVLEVEGAYSATALQHLQVAARSGHRAARLALALFSPEGVAPEGDAWIDEAAGAGHPRAMTVAADRVVEQTPGKAKTLLDRACDLGDEAGCWARAQLELKDAAGKETSAYLALVRRAALLPGLYSATALRRLVRKGNDAPPALVVLARVLVEQGGMLNLTAAESLLIDATRRGGPGSRTMYRSVEEAVAIDAHFQLYGLYVGALPNAAKADVQLGFVIKSGDADALFVLANYHSPGNGRAPDLDKYFKLLELAASKGSADAAASLAADLRLGISSDANIPRARAVMAPFANSEDPRISAEYARTLLAGNDSERTDGVNRLTAIWEKSNDAQIALELASHFSTLADGTAWPTAQRWFERSFQARMKTHDAAYNHLTPSSAGIVAMSAVAVAMNRSDTVTARRWIRLAQALDPFTHRLADDSELLLDIGSAISPEQKKAVRLRLSESAKTSGMASALMGAVALIDLDPADGQDAYMRHFERAYELEGPAVAAGVLDTLLEHLPAAKRDQIWAWLRLTSKHHTPHMRAIEVYLGYRTEASPEARLGHLQSMERLANSGEPFAQGVIGYLNYQGDIAGRVPRSEALLMMLASVRSSTPFAQAYAPLGSAFLRGIGVPKDDEVGRELLKRGVERGSGAAMFEVGQLLLDQTPISGDLAEPRRWAALSQAYGEPRGARLVREIDAREEKRRQDSATIDREANARIAREREEKSRNEFAQRASSQMSSAGSTLAEAFRGAAKFLGELLVVGAVVGVAVLMVAASGYAAGDAPMPPVAYYAPQAVSAARPQATDRSALVPIGMPTYSGGQVTYNPSAIASRPIARAVTATWQSSELASVHSRNTHPRIAKVEIRDPSLDPTRTIRAEVERDGTFRGRSIDGDQVRGFIRSSGSRTEVEMRPGAGLDPTAAYRGTAYGSDGSISLSNPYTGSRVTGTISSGSGYLVR
jgi:TPR repeat protein